MGIDIGLDIQWLYSKGLLDRLLKDKTTGHNILWATDAYSALGMRYGYDEPLSPALITGANAGVIQARAQKGQARRDKRTRQRGEVCTPLWVVKKMIDHADEVWFGAPGRFFDGDTPTPRVQFDREADWQRYVDSRRLEITCGEAPYLVTRYDVESGERIPLARRIGILDRKLRAVNENAANAEWLHWTARAFEACYGYELQGDSLLTARVNLLMTFVEYYRAKWGELPPLDLCRYIANRIAWNIWQMDGLTGTLPCTEQSDPRLSLAELAGADGSAPPLPPPRCRIYNWRGKRSLEYLAMQQEGARIMRFDYIWGNPPYQQDSIGANESDTPLYHHYYEEAFKIADKVELISPARFLFNAGYTPKAWNEKMLSDNHFKVLYYEPKSSKMFVNTDIKGGIVITYRDASKDFGAIGIFTSFPELNTIKRKVDSLSKKNLSEIITNRGLYRYSDLAYHEQPEEMKKTADARIAPSSFERMPALFTDEKPNDKYQYIQIYGTIKSNRYYKWFRKDYVKDVDNLHKFKVIIPKANGSGTFGEILSTPVVIGPHIGFTETFISIGETDTQDEALAILKYIKSKFARTMLGVLKVTQNNAKPTWRYVPLQDFTSASDIDWSQSIPAIDRQLYAKYGLDEREIAFIESHVKEME